MSRGQSIFITLSFVFIFASGCSRRPQQTMPFPPPGVGYPPPEIQVPAKKRYLMVKNDAARELTESAQFQPRSHRTFVTIEEYAIENNGEGEKNQISNVRLEIEFNDGEKKEPRRVQVDLPAEGYWPIGNGQVQEIKRTFEIPYEYVKEDGFRFKVQMVRKGAWIKPCEFKVLGLSRFNRAYICRTDLEWQRSKGIAEENLDKEGIRVRVFTDLHPLPRNKGIPKNVIALRPAN